MHSLITEPVMMDSKLNEELEVIQEPVQKSLKTYKPDDDERETTSNSALQETTLYNASSITDQIKSFSNFEESVYNECTIPLHVTGQSYECNRHHQVAKKKLPKLSSTYPLTANGIGKLKHEVLDLNGLEALLGRNETTSVDNNMNHMENGVDEEDDNDDDMEQDTSQVRFNANKSAHGDMMQSINNLRLNVNNHIIGGSKNIMGRMRKISMSELNRHGRSTGRKYKVTFYATLTALSLLFLYLIYQNLFN